jgi:hypothetical protein
MTAPRREMRGDLAAGRAILIFIRNLIKGRAFSQSLFCSGLSKSGLLHCPASCSDIPASDLFSSPTAGTDSALLEINPSSPYGAIGFQEGNIGDIFVRWIWTKSAMHIVT